MSLLMSDAMAAAGSTPASQADGGFSLIMVAAIFVLLYFMLIRPQSKRVKDHRELVNKLEKGDEIVTSGGILAKITHLDEQFVKAMVAEGIEICLQRTAVSSVLPKGTIKSL